MSDGAYGLAAHKARYGRRDWLVWQDRRGFDQCAPMTKQSIKQAMLDTGTQGWFTLIAAGSTVRHRYGWRIGVTMLRNCQYF